MTSSSFIPCSTYQRDVVRADPLGSASAFARSFLIEMPLPWARVPVESRGVSAEIKAALALFRDTVGPVTVTLIVPDAAYAADGQRLIDVVVRDGHIVQRDIIAHRGSLAAAITAMAHDQPLPASVTVDESPVRDIIVCTHGTRDACCGTYGAPIYQHLRAAADSDTRIWRSSHLGGHRFAPTCVDLANGRAWGFVDEQAADTILTHAQPAATVRPHLRGSVLHSDPGLQLLDGEILARIGWEWDDYHQLGTVLSRDEQGRAVDVEIVATHPQRPPLAFRGRIVAGEEFLAPASCHAEPTQYTRMRVDAFRQLDPV